MKSFPVKPPEKWNTGADMPPSKYFLGESTSRKYENPIKDTIKVKSSTKCTTPSQSSPKSSQAGGRSKPSRQRGHPFSPNSTKTLHASPSTEATLKLLQDHIHSLSEVSDGDRVPSNIKTKRTASLDKGLARNQTTDTNIFGQHLSSQSGLMMRNSGMRKMPIQRLKTCYEDPLKNCEKSDSTGLSSRSMGNELCLQPEKELICTTAIGNFVDILNVNPQINNKETATKNIQSTIGSTQTELCRNNSVCQVCASNTNISTQFSQGPVADDQVDESINDFDESDVVTRITSDSELLLCSLKMYYYQQQLNTLGSYLPSDTRFTSLERFPSYTASELSYPNTASRQEFMNILENFFRVPENMIEESLLTNRSDCIETASTSVYEDCSEIKIIQPDITTENKCTCVLLPEYTKNMDYELLQKSIEASNQLINQLDSYKTIFEKAFDRASEPPQEATEAEVEDTEYQTVNIDSPREYVTDNQISELDKDEVKEDMTCEISQLENTLLGLNEAMLVNNGNARSNQIKQLIGNVSEGLMKLLEHIKCTENPKYIGKENAITQSDIKCTEYLEKTASIDLKLTKSRQESIMIMSTDEGTSNFSTCTELSSDEFEKIEPPQCKQKMSISKPKKQESIPIGKDVSTMSTNTYEYIDPIPITRVVLPKYKKKKKIYRQKRKRSQFRMDKPPIDYAKAEGRNNFSMSEYCATFSTRCARTKTSATQCHHKQLVIVSQTPSIGDFKYVYKEYDTDSAVVVNSSSSCEECHVNVDTGTPSDQTGINNDNLLKVKVEQDTSDWTLAEDLPLKEVHETQMTKRFIGGDKTNFADTGVQISVTVVNEGSAADVELSHAAVQNNVQQTDKDVSTTEVFGETTNESFDEYNNEDSVSEVNFEFVPPQHLESVPLQHLESVPPQQFQSVPPQHFQSVPTAQPMNFKIPSIPSNVMEPSPIFEKPLGHHTIEVKNLCRILDRGDTNDETRNRNRLLHPGVTEELKIAIKSRPRNQLMEAVRRQFRRNVDPRLDVNTSGPQYQSNFTPIGEGLKILSVRCIGERSIIIKWECYSSNPSIIGYQIFVNNVLKTIIHSRLRTTAVIDAVVPKSSLIIRVCSVMENGMVDQMAEATFKMF